MAKLKKVAAELDRFEKGLNQIAAGVLRDEGEKLVRYIKQTKFRSGGNPGPNYIVSRSGKLERSLRSAVRFEGGGLVLTVELDGVQARILEEGGTTRPHRICARRARVLSFFWPKTGKKAFFRCVNHPGSRFVPRRIMERSFEEQSTKIALSVERKMAREWEERLA